MKWPVRRGKKGTQGTYPVSARKKHKYPLGLKEDKKKKLPGGKAVGDRKALNKKGKKSQEQLRRGRDVPSREVKVGTSKLELLRLQLLNMRGLPPIHGEVPYVEHGKLSY